MESQIPDGKASLYTGNEPAVTRPVDESTQAAYTSRRSRSPFCQPDGRWHADLPLRDERARAGWQSGVHDVDGTAKGSLSRVTEALDRTTGGSIVRCPGVQLIVRPTFLRFGTPFAAKRGVFRIVFAATSTAPRSRGSNARRPTRPSSKKRGRSRSESSPQIDLGTRRLAPGQTATRSVSCTRSTQGPDRFPERPFTLP